jgi:ADP-heptose:LPS heptosyltransferase
MSNDVADEAAGSLRGVLARADRLLLVRLRSLGDSILTLPLIRSLRSWRAELHLDVLAEAPFAPVFQNHPAVHETLILRARGSATGWSKPRTALEVLKRRYPVILNLHGGPTSLILTLAGCAHTRIGQTGFRNAWAYNVHLPPSDSVWKRTDLHTVEHQLTIMRWLGLPAAGEFGPGLHVGEPARVAVAERLGRAAVVPGAYIQIHPTAMLPTKQWGAENFARLADALSAEHGLPVIFTAGPAEARVLEQVRVGAGRAHCYWTDLRLEELFALIAGCRLFVGNDSGPTHAAAALGKPVVVVWGSSDYIAWRPWDTRYELVRSDLPCIPCPGYSCAAFGDSRCIRRIPMETVAEACGRVLGSEARPLLSGEHPPRAAEL